MDVQPARPLERSGRHELSVRDGDERVYLGVVLVAEPVRLADRDPETLGGLLRRRRRNRPAAAARAIGLGQQIGDLMPCGEPLEHVCPKRRRRSDGDARHS